MERHANVANWQAMPSDVAANAPATAAVAERHGTPGPEFAFPADTACIRRHGLEFGKGRLPRAFEPGANVSAGLVSAWSGRSDAFFFHAPHNTPLRLSGWSKLQHEATRRTDALLEDLTRRRDQGDAARMGENIAFMFLWDKGENGRDLLRAIYDRLGVNFHHISPPAALQPCFRPQVRPPP